MKTLLAFLLVAICGAPRARCSLQNTGPQSCDSYDDFISQYHPSILCDFSLMMFKTIIKSESSHFVHSSVSIWGTLAALAEGADQQFQHNMFKFLRLSTDPLIRQKYYNLIKSRFGSSADNRLRNTRTLFHDDAVSASRDWLNFVCKNSLLDVASAPMKADPLCAADFINEKMSMSIPNLNINGDSVILDCMDYKPLWTTAFDDAVVSHAPFYNRMGEKIGAVDLMTTTRRAKMVYIPSMNLEVIELPLGDNGRYCVWFLLFQSQTQNLEKLTHDAIIQIKDDLKMTDAPVYIAIPRIPMVTDLDVIGALKKVGMPDMWNNPNAAKFVLDPAGLPASYIQRTTLTFGTAGVNPATTASIDCDPIHGKFIVNRPFEFAIFDPETYTCFISGAYSRPTYV